MTDQPRPDPARTSVDERAAELDVRPFAPLAPDHPMATKFPKECPVCKSRIEVGDVMCLLVLDSPYNREEAENAGGGYYNAEASPAHWRCATGSEDPLGDYERWYEAT